MTNGFPDLREGETWSEQSALEWRNVVDAVSRFNGLAVGPGLLLDKAGQGLHLSLVRKPPVRIPPPSKAVVLVEVPSGSAEDRPWLLVREVEYATPARMVEPPANQAPYRWRGVAFQAYPQIGRTPADYFGALWDERDDDDVQLPIPTPAATFLTATFDGSVWVLDLPSASVVAQFQFWGSRADHILGRLFDGATVSTQVTKIAKPYLLRQTTYDGQERDGISYVSTRRDKRTATRGGTDPSDAEQQIVVPAYLLDDLVYATAHVKGGVDVSVDGAPLVWLDDNRDGRAWAAEFPEEEASA